MTNHTSKPDKNGFPHYMLKEIYEQPEAVRETIEACVNSAGHIALPGSGISEAEVRKLRKIDIAASGTSRHAGLAGEFMIERMTGLPAPARAEDDDPGMTVEEFQRLRAERLGEAPAPSPVGPSEPDDDAYWETFDPASLRSDR